MRIAVLLDGDRLARWQAEALRRLPAGTELLLYRCTNSRRRVSPLRHAAYYALNRWSLRLRATQLVPLPAELTIAATCDFASEWSGAWQSLPASLLDRIADDRPAAIIKFGMGLLRVPDGQALSVPILSYHHGDPRRFRGRPAGLWEIAEGAPVVGQVVQRLSNRLDAGDVLAFAETKVHPHSWSATLAEAYRVSPLLLRPALDRVIAGEPIPLEPSGRNYRLPSNAMVARLSLRMMARAAKRLIYGAVREKAWVVATSPVAEPAMLPSPESWTVLPTPPATRFLADPFPHPHGGLLLEALRSKDGVGEIVHWARDGARTLIGGPSHLSYPATFEWNGVHYCVPEVVDWSPARSFRLLDGQSEDLGPLDLPGRPRLLDPTPYVHEGRVYLFGNIDEEGPCVLRLWHADDPFGRFAEHPASPLRISPAGARMGGSLLTLNDRLVRVGQDGRRGYGDGLSLFTVTDLSPVSYREELLQELRFEHVRGPHTLNRFEDGWVFDFYRERWAPLAGYRRLRARLAKKAW